MKKFKIKKTISHFVKSYILCARSAFIEKNALTALQDSYTDLMKRIDQESSKQIRMSNKQIQRNDSTTILTQETPNDEHRTISSGNEFISDSIEDQTGRSTDSS